MINSLPKSLVESAKLILDEALAAPAHKTLASKAANSSKNQNGLTAAEQVSKDVMSSDRVTVPLQRTLTPNASVVKHLAKHGFKIHDYEQGLAYHQDKPDRKLRIGRVLNQTDASEFVSRSFEKDPARQGIKSSDASVVISRKPTDVAAMSTHQNWTSCQTLGGKAKVKDSEGNVQERTQEKGCYSELVPGIVSSGAHIAYLVHKPEDVDEHYKPVARTTLNVYESPNKHKILRPSEEYGDHWEGFHNTVKQWAEKHFPTKDPVYYRHHGSYPEGENQIRNYGDEHNEFWKNEQDPTTLKEHPNPEVLKHHTDRIIREGNGNISSLISNPNLSIEDSDRIVNNFATHIRQSTSIASNARTPQQIQKMYDSNLGNYHIAKALAGNKNTTHAQLHDLIDTYVAGQTNVPGTRNLVHNGHSPEIMLKVADHSNANDSHFNKLFELKDFHSNDPVERFHTALDHYNTLNVIGRRYNSEEIGKKLIATQTNLPEVNHHVIYDVAEKHPHLLNAFKDSTIADTLKRHGQSPALQKIALDRNTPETLRALANVSEDRELLGKLSNHSDEYVAKNAQHSIKMLDMAGK